jgi:hypothetical protein
MNNKNRVPTANIEIKYGGVSETDQDELDKIRPNSPNPYTKKGPIEITITLDKKTPRELDEFKLKNKKNVENFDATWQLNTGDQFTTIPSVSRTTVNLKLRELSSSRFTSIASYFE